MAKPSSVLRFIPSTVDSTDPSFQNELLVYENEFAVFFLLKSCLSIHIIASVLTVKEVWKTKSNGVLNWWQTLGRFKQVIKELPNPINSFRMKVKDEVLIKTMK